MGSVCVVSDSTADLPPGLAASHHIEVVPLRVLFGSEAYADGVDLTAEEFYRRLKLAKELPKTSQPSAGEFRAVYERLARDGRSVISIHISSKLSGTVASAEAARAMLPGADISVVDGLSASLGTGLLALRAAREAAAGRPKGEIVRLIEGLVQRLRVLFVVDTLEYLHKGGRIGGATALLGGLLSFKPILAIRDGRVEPLERVRTKPKAVERLIDLVAEDAAPGSQLNVGVLHGQAPGEADLLASRVQHRFACHELIVGEVGSVIATHAGPGVVGLVYYAEP